MREMSSKMKGDTIFPIKLYFQFKFVVRVILGVFFMHFSMVGVGGRPVQMPVLTNSTDVPTPNSGQEQIATKTNISDVCSSRVQRSPLRNQNQTTGLHRHCNHH